MAANSWLELSGTNLSQLSSPDEGPPTGTRDGGLFSYSSGVFHPGRKSFFAWGGGHADYAGNEFYRLNLSPYSAAFGEWTQETDPYTWATTLNTGDLEEVGTPTQPVSRHTYGMLAYSGEYIVVIGGGALFSSAHGSAIVWLYHTRDKTWTKQTATSPGGDSQNAVAQTDSTGTVYYIRPGTDQDLQTYDVAGDTLTASTNATWSYSFNSSSALRETGSTRELWTLSRGTMRSWDLTQDVAPSTVTQTGAPYTGDHDSHGFVYVPSTDRFIATSGGTDINTLNPNGTWTSQTPTGDTPPSADANGTYKRFFYHAQLDRCFAIHSTTANVFCYRPPASY